jgi:23S rRNA (adenine2503-C2)-methyltransferase
MEEIKSEANLVEMLVEMGEKPFRAKQIWGWLYNKGCDDFLKMTDLSSDLREKLSNCVRIPRLENRMELMSRDGTIKWLLGLDDKNEIETVFIPEEKRGTICVSSQVGCTLTCKFCHTGTQKLVRNLSTDEIVSQVMIARDMLNDWCNSTEKRLTNIVFMGMGEPMLNYENVADAVRVLTHRDGLNYGKKRITISTSGLVPQINRCATELGVRLAISLHAVTDDLRDELVPINRKYPIRELLNACQAYASATGGERITFEYVMLDGVNDSEEHAKKLVSLLKNIPSKVNLIPFNPWPGSQYKCSSREKIQKFAAIVEKAGYTAPVRVTRGQDIMAACGQLKSSSIKLNRKLQNQL